jgi:hypothetical protein
METWLKVNWLVQKPLLSIWCDVGFHVSKHEMEEEAELHCECPYQQTISSPCLSEGGVKEEVT